MPKNKDMGFYIHHIDGCLYKLMNRRLKELDVTPSQLEILKFLHHHEADGKPVIQKDIETYLHISNPTVSGMISRLEQKGFVERVRSEKDRRTCNIRVTEKGKQFKEALGETSRAWNEMFVDCLGEDEYKRVLASLDKVLKALVQQEKEDSL